MAQLYNILKPENTYFDRKYYENIQDYNAALAVTTTVYVGNLSFFTTQDSVHQLFSMAGKVTQIIMGINDQGHPCGFCFVIYQTREEASNAVEFISKTKLNDRVIRVDWDAGFKKGREKGRGTGGQQRRDDFRTKEDTERPRKKPAYQQRDRDRGDRPERQERDRTRQPRDYDRRREGQYRQRRRQRQYGDREDRGDRGDRGERGDRGDRGDKVDKVDKGDRRDRGQRQQRGENQRQAKETIRNQADEY